MSSSPIHVDDFIDTFGTDPYASWVLNHFRMSAIFHAKCDQFMADHKLFATYEGKRYRVTGASRLGDVWLATDFARDTGYDLRVDIEKCSKWSDKP